MQRTITFVVIAGFVIAAAAMTVEAQKSEKKKAGVQERFSVTASEEEGYVMVEQRTGRTWMLEYSMDDEPTWLPIQRIDDAAEGKAWREKRDAAWEQQEREERREATARRELQTKQQRLIALFSEVTSKLKIAEARLRESAAEFDDDDQRVVEALRSASRELKQQLEDVAEELQSAPETTTRNDDHQPGAESFAAQVLLPLLVEQELLLQTHGPEHPKVREVRKKIEVTRKLQADETIE